MNMKNISLSTVFLLLISCNSSIETKTPKMPGTYFMESQTVKSATTEKTYKDLKQLKIYTDNYFMYVQVNPGDSTSTFGLGTYTTDTGTVNEHSQYRAIDTAITDTPQDFKLLITRTTDGYEQVIPEMKSDTSKYRLTEVYRKVGMPDTSTINGIWKESKSFQIAGSDTIKNNRIQYKAFNDGYFMFGQLVKDSSGKRHTGIGFGTFKIVNENEIKEMELNSTYKFIMGKEFTINLTWDGKDHFSQSFTDADGNKVVEYYDRLKQ
jgi:hypothetical protein